MHSHGLRCICMVNAYVHVCVCMRRLIKVSYYLSYLECDFHTKASLMTPMA